MRQIRNLLSIIFSTNQTVVSYEDYEPINTYMDTTVLTSHRSLRIDY